MKSTVWENVGGKIEVYIEKTADGSCLYYRAKGSNRSDGIRIEEAEAIHHAVAYFKNSGEWTAMTKGEDMKMTREMILRNRLEMANHNLRCYSTDYSCTTPKEGQEEEYKEATAEIEILEAWLKEFHFICTNSIREFIGHINSITYGTTYENKSFAQFIQFEVDTGADYTQGDLRTFHIGPEVQNWFLGEDGGKYDSEKDHRNSRLVKITVDRIEYVRSIEWVIAEETDEVEKEQQHDI